MRDWHKEKEDNYIECAWCGGEIYYDKYAHDDAYDVDGEIICDRCFSEYQSECSGKADDYFESLFEEE